MILELDHITLPLARFPLQVTARLTTGITGLSGPSGSGKTSLLETIAGLRRPTTGRLLLHGTLLSDAATGHFTPAWQRRIGYVPQETALFPHWTAAENLAAHQRLTGQPNDPDRLQTILHLLELQPLLTQKPATLSGGEQARLALARALLSQPQLLLLDEPLAHLDDRLRDLALTHLRQVNTTFHVPILIVSHSARELTTLCDQILTIDHGRITPALSLPE